MLRLLLLLTLLLGFAGQGAAATAADFNSVDGFAPSFIKADDPVGKGFNWTKNLPCGANHATLQVRFKATYPSGEHMPVAKVWLHSPKTDVAPEQWIAAVLKAPTDPYKLNAMEWLEKVEDSAGQGPGFAPADLNSPVQLDFGWSPDGVVTVNFGDGIVKYVTATSPITELGLSVSWAKFEFISMKVGRTGAQDPACATNMLLAGIDAQVPKITKTTASTSH
jgi:hypothetical protein